MIDTSEKKARFILSLLNSETLEVSIDTRRDAGREFAVNTLIGRPFGVARQLMRVQM